MVPGAEVLDLNDDMGQDNSLRDPTDSSDRPTPGFPSKITTDSSHLLRSQLNSDSASWCPGPGSGQLKQQNNRSKIIEEPKP